MKKERIPYTKYTIEETIEFCKTTSDWKDYAKEKHLKVFTDLINDASIEEVCEKYLIKKGNIYDYSLSLRYRYENKITGKKKKTVESEKLQNIRKYFEAVTEEEMFELLSNKEYEYSLLFKNGMAIINIAKLKGVSYETIFSSIVGTGSRIGAANKIFRYIKTRDGEIEE